MVNSLITYEEAKLSFAKAPSCKPRPNAKNIMALERFFVEKATTIPCAHELAHGFG